MGQATAEGMAECVREGLAPLATALRYHLTVNHFPPVSDLWVGPCIEAMQAIQQGDDQQEIMGPWGQPMPARRLCEGLHLDAFIGLEEED